MIKTVSIVRNRFVLTDITDTLIFSINDAPGFMIFQKMALLYKFIYKKQRLAINIVNSYEQICTSYLQIILKDRE